MSTMTATASAAEASFPAIAVVIPCYRERGHILDVVMAIGPNIRHIIVVDDACPDGTGDHVRQNVRDDRVEVLIHDRNQGVGGATLTGYARAIEVGADIIVKLDGDGQMDPALIPTLIEPVVAGRADYAKGNRFQRIDSINAMPKLRILGNVVLSFMSKMSSGYWNVFDCTNGFTAIHASVARLILDRRPSAGFFFESDMLFHLGVLRAVVVDVPMKARYGSEESSLNLWHSLFEFSAKHWLNAMLRIFYTYFVRDVGVATVELISGKALFLFGIIFGAIEWHESIETGIPATAGTVAIAVLPIIVGSQLLIAFLNFDVRNIPQAPLHPLLGRY